MRAGDSEFWRNYSANKHSIGVRSGSASMENGTLMSGKYPAVETSQGLLKGINEHIASFKNKLIKLQGQLRSPTFNKVDAYGSINNVLNEAEKLQTEITYKIRSVYNSNRIQATSERENNKLLEEIISKLRLLSLKGNTFKFNVPESSLGRSPRDPADQLKLKGVLKILNLPEDLATKESHHIENEVRDLLANLKRSSINKSFKDGAVSSMTDSRLEPSNQLALLQDENSELKTQIRDLTSQLQKIPQTQGDGLLKKRVTELEFEIKKLKEWNKSTEIEARKQLEEERSKSQNTLNLLDERIKSVEEEYAIKLAEWKNVALENQVKLEDYIKNSEKELSAKENDMNLKHKKKVTDLESTLGKLKEDLRKKDLQLEEFLKNQETLVGELQSKLETEFQLELNQQLNEKEVAHARLLSDIHLKWQKAEGERSDLLQKVQSLTSSMNRMEVNHREEIMNLKDNFLNESALNRQILEEGMKEKEKIVQPFLRDIERLENELKLSNKEKDEISKECREKVLKAQEDLNIIIKEKESLESQTRGLELKLYQTESDFKAKLEGMAKESSRIELKHQSTLKLLQETKSTCDSTVSLFESKLEIALRDNEQLKAELEKRMEKASEFEFYKKTQESALELKELELSQVSQKYNEMQGKGSIHIQNQAEEVRKLEESHQLNISSLQESIDSLTKNTLSLNDIIESLQKQLKEVQQQKDQVTDENHNLKQTVKKATEEVDFWREANQKLIEDFELKQIQLLDSESSKIKGIKEGFEELLASKENQIIELEELVKNINFDKESLTSEIGFWQNKATELENKLKDMQFSIGNNQSELENKYAEQLKNLEAELEKTKMTKLTELTEEKLQEIENLKKIAKAKIDQETEEMNVTKSKIAEILQETESKELELSKKLKEVEASLENSNQQKAIVETLKAKFEADAKSNEKVKEELEREKNLLSQKTKEFLISQENLQHKADEVDSKLNEIKQSEKLINEMEKRVWNDQEFLAEKNELINKLESENSELKAKLETLETEVESLKKENEGLQIQKNSSIGVEQASSLMKSSGELLGLGHLKPTQALLSSPLLASKLVVTNSFELGDDLEKSFDLIESMVIPPLQKSQDKLQVPGGDTETTKLKEKITRLEKTRDQQLKEIEEMRTKDLEWEMKVTKMQKEVGRISSEKSAIENLLYRVGVEKRSRINQLIKEIEQLEMNNKRNVVELQKDFEKIKAKELEALEKTWKEKFEKQYKEQQKIPIEQKKISGDDWLESEEESSEKLSSARNRQEKRLNLKDDNYHKEGKSPYVLKSQGSELSNINTARSVPAQNSPVKQIHRDTPIISERKLNDYDQKNKRHWEGKDQLRDHDDENPYVLKKSGNPQTPKSTQIYYVRKEQDVQLPHAEKSPGIKEKPKGKGKTKESHEEEYVARPVEPVYIPKPQATLTVSHVQDEREEEDLTKSMLFTQQMVKEINSKKETENPEPKKTSILLSDILQPDDLTTPHKSDDEWYKIDPKGKASPVKIEDSSSSKAEERPPGLRSDLASSQFFLESNSMPRFTTQEEDASSQIVEKKPETKKIQNSQCWSVLKDDDFSQYYQEPEIVEDSARGSVATNPANSEQEEIKTISEKKKKKKKKNKTKDGPGCSEGMDLMMMLSHR